jgi:hypothetical protein
MLRQVAMLRELRLQVQRRLLEQKRQELVRHR